MSTDNKIYAFVFDKSAEVLAELLKSNTNNEFRELVDTDVPKADKYITHGVYYNQSVPMVMNVVKPEHIYTHILYNATARPGRSLYVNGTCVLVGYNGDNIDAVTSRVAEVFNGLDIDNMEFSEVYN